MSPKVSEPLRTDADEVFLPMDVSEWDVLDTETFLYTGTLLRDFGPWRQGETRSLVFNFGEGSVKEHDDNGDVVNEIRVRLTPITAEGD